MLTTLKELKSYYAADLYRYSGNCRKISFLKSYMLDPGFKYTFHMRLCNYLHSKNFIFKPLYALSCLMFLHYKQKFGICIPFKTKIGKGLHISNIGSIGINNNSVIGDNCNIGQGVAIGSRNRGKYEGSPTIGNGVYIGSGAKVIGSVIIGNNVAIGANCVVTTDVPDNAVVVGVPGKVISYQGAEEYIFNTDYS